MSDIASNPMKDITTYKVMKAQKIKAIIQMPDFQVAPVYFNPSFSIEAQLVCRTALFNFKKKHRQSLVCYRAAAIMTSP